MITEKIMDEKFKKHYLQVVKTVTEQGEQIKKLNGMVFELQGIVAKLKSDMITHGMTPEDKEQFQRVFQSDEENNKTESDSAVAEDPKPVEEKHQETLGC